MENSGKGFNWTNLNQFKFRKHSPTIFLFQKIFFYIPVEQRPCTLFFFFFFKKKKPHTSETRQCFGKEVQKVNFSLCLKFFTLFKI